MFSPYTDRRLMRMYSRFTPGVLNQVSWLESFIGTQESTLESHVGDGGNVWARNPPTTGMVRLSGAGTIFHSTAAIPDEGTDYVTSIFPSTPDYLVQATFRKLSAMAGVVDGIGIWGRYEASSGNKYQLWYDNQALQFQLFRHLGAGAIVLGTSNVPLNVGTPVVGGLRAVGTSIKAILDGVEVISVVNAEVTVAGQVGIRMFNRFDSAPSTFNTKLHLGPLSVTLQ